MFASTNEKGERSEKEWRRRCERVWEWKRKV
jgi:hypothetical protein